MNDVKDEQLEFQISQYADGTLPAAEAAALEEVFATDRSARELLAQYRSLDAALKRELPLPGVRWDRLAEHLSVAVAEEAEENAPAPIPLFRRTGALVALAASVLLLIGIISVISLRPPGRVDVASGDPPMPPAPAPPQAVAVVQITGPAIEMAAAPAEVAITLDAPPHARRLNTAETIVYRPPRVVIASGQSDRQDNSRLPY